MRIRNKPLLKLSVVGILLILVVCLLAVTPLGYWLVRGIAGLASLPGIAWAREHMASTSTPGEDTGAAASSGGSSAIDAILDAGRELQEKGLTEEALDRYREALQRDPGYLRTHISLADLYIKTGRTKDAAQELEKAAELAPDNAAIHAKLGELYYELDEYESGVRVLERAKEIDPQDPDIRHLLGLTYFYRSRADAVSAVAEMEETASLTPDDAEVQYHLAMAYIVREADGDTERAIKALEKATRLDPAKSDAYLQLGRMYLESGRAEAAVAAWEQYVATSDDAETVEKVRQMIRNVRQMSSGQ